MDAGNSFGVSFAKWLFKRQRGWLSWRPWPRVRERLCHRDASLQHPRSCAARPVSRAQWPTSGGILTWTNAAQSFPSPGELHQRLGEVTLRFAELTSDHLQDYSVRAPIVMPSLPATRTCFSGGVRHPGLPETSSNPALAAHALRSLAMMAESMIGLGEPAYRCMALERPAENGYKSIYSLREKLTAPDW
jgi:hypothetical protein